MLFISYEKNYNINKVKYNCYISTIQHHEPKNRKCLIKRVQNKMKSTPSVVEKGD